MSTPESIRRYGGRSVADRQVERRTRLLEAGLTVFGEHGYANSSVTTVCRAACLSIRQFYEEFTSRESLLVAIYDDIQVEMRETVMRAMKEVENPSFYAQLQATIRAYIECVGTDARRAKIAFVEIVGVSTEIERHRGGQRRVWGSLLEAAADSIAADRLLPKGDRHLAFVAFIGAVNSTVQEWSLSDPRPPLDDVIAMLSSMLAGAIGPESSRS